MFAINHNMRHATRYDELVNEMEVVCSPPSWGSENRMVMATNNPQQSGRVLVD